MDFTGHTGAGLGIACGAILSSLIERLIDRGALLPEDVPAIFHQATTDLAPSRNIVSVEDASRFIAKLAEDFQRRT